MSNCSTCYNGCTQIISDQCVKYTGVDAPALGIQKGDSIFYVQQALIEFLSSALDGTGVIPNFDSDILCAQVVAYLPTQGDLSITDISVALIKSVCALYLQLDEQALQWEELNTGYDPDCVTGIPTPTNVRNIIEGILTKVCTIENNLSALSQTSEVEYVRALDLNTLIADYLNSISVTSLVKNKMIPYTAMEYYGPLSYFDATGAGTGNWIKVYLCNGNNNTPDKRGRVPVGTTTEMGGPAFDNTVNPNTAGNPAYSLSTKAGANTTTLTVSQLPSHSHANTALTSPHTHYTVASSGNTVPMTSSTPTIVAAAYNDNFTYRLAGASAGTANVAPTNAVETPITMTNADTGSGSSHSNIQPVLACHYIIYIP